MFSSLERWLFQESRREKTHKPQPMALNLRPHKQRPGWLRRFLGEDPSGSLVCVLHHANRPPAVVIEGRWVPGFRVLGFGS